MSVGYVRDHYVKPWFEHVELVTFNLDQGRIRISTHYPELKHLLPTSLEVTSARLATDKLLTALEKRTTEFAFGGAVREGPDWDHLQQTYFDACAEIRQVQTSLELSIDVLFRDEGTLPPPKLVTDMTRLTSKQRQNLEKALSLIGQRTDRLLNQARSFFVHGKRLVASTVASSHGSDTNQ